MKAYLFIGIQLFFFHSTCLNPLYSKNQFPSRSQLMEIDTNKLCNSIRKGFQEQIKVKICEPSYLYHECRTENSDTIIDVVGSIRSSNNYYGKGSRLINNKLYTNEILYLEGDSAFYGLRVNLKNKTYEGAGISTIALGKNTGLKAYSERYYGIIANSNSGIGGFFSSDSNHALITGQGNVGIGTGEPSSKLDVSGNLNVDGELNRHQRTGNANLLPIAYGVVREPGDIHTSTGNVKCTYNHIKAGYEISVNHEHIIWLNYISIVTPISDSAVEARTLSEDGKLIVYLSYNDSPKLSAFQFIIYKP